MNKIKIMSKIYYHGTNKEFDKFENKDGTAKISTIFGSEIVDRVGFFFSKEKEFAAEFGSNLTKWELNIKNTLDLTSSFNDDEVMSQFIEDGWSERMLINTFPEYIWEFMDGENGPDFLSTLERYGYDSIKMLEADNKGVLQEAVVVFDSNKIKKHKKKKKHVIR